MTVELRPEDQAAMQSIVNKGHYASVGGALHTAVQSFTEEHEAWLPYTREAIQEGLEGVAAGRVVDGETFFRDLRAQARSAD